MKLRLLLTALSAAAAVFSAAAPIDSIAASDRAAAFLHTLHPARAIAAVQSLSHLGAPRAAYAFTDGAGTFVLVAADDRLPSILGYGQTGSTVPPAFTGLLASYARQLTTAPDTRTATTVTTPADTAADVRPRPIRPVQPLLPVLRRRQRRGKYRTLHRGLRGHSPGADPHLLSPPHCHY